MMFRFMDTNIEGVDRKTALKELKNLHEKAYKDTLTPGHLYIDVGSVAGADLVRTYFKSAGADVALHMDKERRDWRRGSPIVIGNLRTSSALRGIFESSDSDGLAYRLDEKRYAWMHIRKPDDPEIEALRAIGVEVKPEGDFTMPSRDINFGVVSRLPNPSGSGVMTFICSDGTFAAMQMALALTKEDQLRSFFNRMGWRIDRPVPDTFEMLFHVRLWPGGMHDQGSEAKLVCWRPHPG
ncbi:MAG: hypothetical protein JO323_14565 [Acidobacteriia bacterium]|nr:hypothetical protein [Terriglobia bacterium]